MPIRYFIKSLIWCASGSIRRFPQLHRAFPQGGAPSLKEVILPVDGLVSEFRLGWMSDLHLGWTTNTQTLSGLCQLLADSNLDYCAFGGDIVDEDAREARQMKRVVQALHHARIPMGAVRGNHDLHSRYGGATEVAKWLEWAGISTHINQALAFSGTFGHLSLCFLDDPFRGMPNLSFCTELSGPRIILCHSPEIFGFLDWPSSCTHPLLGPKGRIDPPAREEAPQELAQHLCASGFLFGHTHGGQIAKAGLLALRRGSYARRFLKGIQQAGSAWTFTSSGAGNSTLPVRIGVAPEAVLVRLVPPHWLSPEHSARLIA